MKTKRTQHGLLMNKGWGKWTYNGTFIRELIESLTEHMNHNDYKHLYTKIKLVTQQGTPHYDLAEEVMTSMDARFEHHTPVVIIEIFVIDKAKDGVELMFMCNDQPIDPKLLDELLNAYDQYIYQPNISDITLRTGGEPVETIAIKQVEPDEAIKAHNQSNEITI